MVTQFETIYQANGILQAIAVQGILDADGIPSLLVNTDGSTYIDVRVPAERADEAREMLNPETPHVENFVCQYQA